MSRATLLDVAKHCGVSRATVSLVLNDSPLVAEKTRLRVQQALSEMGYVYNRAAASLRPQRSDANGVVQSQLTNPNIAEFAAGLQDVLTGSRTVPLLTVSNEDRVLQRRLVKSLVERNVDAIVLVPAHGTTPADLPDLLGTPLVLLARKVPGVEADYVGAMNADGGYAAAEHLYSHGCRRIAFLGGYADSSARQERRGGVQRFLAEREVSFEPDMSPECSPLRPQSRVTAREFIQSHEVDGIICFSDIVAFGVLDAMADLDLSVGSSIRVIGFDDVHEAGLNRPSLSTVAVPARESGRRAAEIVLQRAQGSTDPAIREEFPVKLQPRETCGCPRPKIPEA
jgi:LacI family transcriptional regulator